jgi:hypothetical protein
MARWTKAERDDALASLREELEPGDTVYCIVRRVAASGMSRVISLKAWTPSGPRDLSYRAAKALGWSYSEKGEGVKVEGCGMDMGFHLVYSLARVVFPEGGTLAKSTRRAFSSHQTRETDGGYLLRHEYL